MMFYVVFGLGLLAGAGLYKVAQDKGLIPGGDNSGSNDTPGNGNGGGCSNCNGNNEKEVVA